MSQPLPGPDRRATAPILLVTGSHGLPATQARLARTLELARALRAQGALVDIVVLLERCLQPPEEEALDALLSLAHESEVVRHPSLDPLWGAACSRVAEALRLGAGLGGKQLCPGRLVAHLRQRQVRRGYRAVIVSGVHLAPTLRAFPRTVDRILDLPRLGSEAFTSHCRAGRPDECAVFAEPEAELRLLRDASLVLVGSEREALALRQAGHPGETLRVPPFQAPPPAPSRGTPLHEGPIRPYRILYVGSDTAANLDGLRWFRRQVFPAISRAVPTCRLRIVGEAARHIEPGPGVDRLGWVDRLDEEYRDAALVALPLRMGSGVRRRLVEALGHGKVLATTAVGADGSGVAASHDAIVADRPEELAAEMVNVLTSDSLRCAYERHAALLAADWFSQLVATEPLCRWLGLQAADLDLAPPVPRSLVASRLAAPSETVTATS